MGCYFGGAKPLTFLKAFPGPLGRPDLKKTPQQIRPDCLQAPRSVAILAQGNHLARTLPSAARGGRTALRLFEHLDVDMQRLLDSSVVDPHLVSEVLGLQEYPAAPWRQRSWPVRGGLIAIAAFAAAQDTHAPQHNMHDMPPYHSSRATGPVQRSPCNITHATDVL